MHLHYSEKTSTSNQTQMQLSYVFYSQLFITCLKWNTRSTSKQLLLSWMLIIQCAALHTETNTIVLDWCRVRFHVSNSHIMGDYQYHHTPGQATFISKIK